MFFSSQLLPIRQHFRLTPVILKASVSCHQVVQHGMPYKFSYGNYISLLYCFKSCYTSLQVFTAHSNMFWRWSGHVTVIFDLCVQSFIKISFKPFRATAYVITFLLNITKAESAVPTYVACFCLHFVYHFSNLLVQP